MWSQRRAHEVEGPEEVDAGHLLGALGVELRERGGVGDPGVGDHGVEPARLADESLDSGVERAGVADVGGHHDRARAARRRAPPAPSRRARPARRSPRAPRARARSRARCRGWRRSGSPGYPVRSASRGGEHTRAGRIDPDDRRQATVAEEEYLQIIFWLEEAKLPITGANIARAMQLSPPTVHEMVGRLEGDGYVARTEDKTHRVHRQGPRRGRGDRPPPPPDRALPHRRPRHPLGRGPRGGRAPRARDVARAGGAHARRDRRREDLPPRPPDRRGRPRGGRAARRRRARRQGPILRFENEAEELLHYLKDSGLNPGLEGELKSSDDSEVVVSSGDGDHSVSRSVAETVSVRADPAPAPRAPLPEQLVLSSDKYGR